MMRILYWTGSFQPRIGGVEVLSAQFLPSMQARGHEFLVVTAKGDASLADEECGQEIPVHRLPFGNGLADHDLRAVKETIRRAIEIRKTFKPDVIHLNSMDVSLFFHLMTEGADTAPSLFTVHSLPPNPRGNHSLLSKMLDSAAWVTSPSGAMMRELRNLAKEISSRSSVIHNGLRLPDIQPAPLSFDGPVLLCIGRLVWEKGFDLALDALETVLDRFPTARLMIAGDGPARADLERKAAGYQSPGAAEFRGWVPPERVPELINTATAVIIPSRWEEPFGLVALQAAQMARPVVAARVGGLAEIVEHQETGLLFDKEDRAALAERIVFLLEHRETAQRMGRAARKRAAEVFDFERYLDSYERLYNKLAALH